MTRSIRIAVCIFALVLFPYGTIRAAGIFNAHSYAGGDRRPASTYEEERIIPGHEGEPTTLAFRLSLYGSSGNDLPLLIQVHEWGGDFAREEDMASYVPAEYDFVMLYFQYKPSEGNQDDWWFGTHWDGMCHMWAHDAVMGVVMEALESSMISDHLPGVTVDPHRVYLFGHSIGGTGSWQLGMRHPEVFAAIHAHSGFARFTPPVGPFGDWFEDHIVGDENDEVTILGHEALVYPARDYSNLAWWLTNSGTPAWETPFANITAGTADDIVPAAAGGDLMLPVLESQKRGFFYHRHSGGHSEECFVQMNWMWNFRRNQSFLAFTNRTGYGIAPDETVAPGEWSDFARGGINDLYEFGWDPDTIIDEEDHYEVQLEGSGTADVTPRRLQQFEVIPGATYLYWLNTKTGPGTPISADEYGLVTILSVSGGSLLIIEPDPDEVIVSHATQLANAVAEANAGGPRTILLEEGTYTLDDMLWVEADGVTVRSLSGNREVVIIQGNGMDGDVTHVFNVAGSHFTVRDVTLRRVSQHAIQLQLDVDDLSIRNVHILDTGEQMVKAAYDPHNPALSSDRGVVEECLLEYSAGIGPQWYIGGIDAHNAKDWIVRNNTIVGIRSPSEDVAEFAIHFWSDSENTLVERNTIINCDRGIGFGLGDHGHIGGIIRNNMIYHDTSEGFADVGIALESAAETQVYNNTVFQEHSYPNGIEFRFSDTRDVLIANNLTNRAISQRDGATGTVSHNITDAQGNWFVSPAEGDLHLGLPTPSVVNQGAAIPGLSHDFDGETRPQGAGIDIGADEWVASGLAIDYGALGLLVYDGPGFTRLGTADPEWLCAYDDKLVVDYGSAYGLKQYDGVSWTTLGTADPDNTGNTMVAYGTGVAVDYGSLGLWYYDGSTWSRQGTADPEWLCAYGDNLVVDYGSAYGLYEYDGASWTRLGTADPDNSGNTMVAYGTGIAVDYGSSYGLWYYDGSTWNRLGTADPEWLGTYGDRLLVDYGSADDLDGGIHYCYGLWEYDGSSWTPLGSANPDNSGNTMVAYDIGIVVDYGTAYGLKYYNGSTWSRLGTADPEWLCVYGERLIGDYGSLGLWEYHQDQWHRQGSADPDDPGSPMVEVTF